MLCKLVHANDSETIQTKTTEEYFSVVQFILLRKVVQTIYSVVQMLKCYGGAILSCQRGTVFYAVQGGCRVY